MMQFEIFIQNRVILILDLFNVISESLGDWLWIHLFTMPTWINFKWEKVWNCLPNLVNDSIFHSDFFLFLESFGTCIYSISGCKGKHQKWFILCHEWNVNLIMSFEGLLQSLVMQPFFISGIQRPLWQEYTGKRERARRWDQK